MAQCARRSADLFTRAPAAPNCANAAREMVARRRRVALPLRGGVLYTLFLSSLPIQEQLISHAEAHVPAQPSSPFEDARVSHQDEDEERAGGAVTSARQGTQAGVR